ncbi:MAG: phage DNA encapsidation protein [Sarcina sp.]
MTKKFIQDGKYFEIQDFIDLFDESVFMYQIIGARGVGKSWSSQRKMIQEFLDFGYQGMIVRRYQKQADKMQKTYWDKIITKEFPDLKFKQDGAITYINNEVFCLFTGLNGTSNEKGGSFPDIRTVLYEEIQPEAGEKIIPEEYMRFRSLLDSIDRWEDRVKVIMIGNNTSYYNPVSETLKLYAPLSEGEYTNNQVMAVLNLESSSEFKESAFASNMGRLALLDGTADYNINNKNKSNDMFNVISKKKLWDTDKFIAQMKIRIGKEKVVCIWKCESDRCIYYYIDNNSKPNVIEFFYDWEYQNEDNFFINQCSSETINVLNTYHAHGVIYFNSGETKYYFENFRKYFKNYRK